MFCRTAIDVGTADDNRRDDCYDVIVVITDCNESLVQASASKDFELSSRKEFADLVKQCALHCL